MNTSSLPVGRPTAVPTTSQKKVGTNLVSPKKLADINSIQNPLNKLLFDQVKSQMKPGEAFISEGRMHGKVRLISQKNNELIIELDSYIPTMKHNVVWYTYSQEWIPKIEVFEGDDKTKKIALSDIKSGDEIYIYEKDDYAKSFPEAIVSVKIVKLAQNI